LIGFIDFMQIKEVLLEVLVPLTREKCPDKSFSDFVTRAAGKIIRFSVAKKIVISVDLSFV
jgi:hypothetical protein